jgi:hypothetical protein
LPSGHGADHDAATERDARETDMHTTTDRSTTATHGSEADAPARRLAYAATLAGIAFAGAALTIITLAAALALATPAGAAAGSGTPGPTPTPTGPGTNTCQYLPQLCGAHQQITHSTAKALRASSQVPGNLNAIKVTFYVSCADGFSTSKSAFTFPTGNGVAVATAELRPAEAGNASVSCTVTQTMPAGSLPAGTTTASSTTSSAFADVAVFVNN